jgi:hypothetical protein
VFEGKYFVWGCEGIFGVFATGIGDRYIKALKGDRKGNTVNI